MGKWLDKAKMTGQISSLDSEYIKSSISGLPEVEFVFDNKDLKSVVRTCPYVLPRKGEVVELKSESMDSVGKFLVKSVKHIYFNDSSTPGSDRMIIELSPA